MPLNIEDRTLTIKRAIFSVTDKAGIDTLAKAIRAASPSAEIFGTAGSQKSLQESGVENVGSITELTGNSKPDFFDHRMATISFNFESALLADREKPEHMAQLAELGIKPIDLVVCNLYPFEEAIAEAKEKGVTPEELMKIAIEKIDIGGPCMVRAAAKNWHSVAILTDPLQYPDFIKELKERGGISLETRQHLAHVAFRLTKDYDIAIEKFFYEATFGKE